MIATYDFIHRGVYNSYILVILTKIVVHMESIVENIVISRKGKVLGVNGKALWV